MKRILCYCLAISMIPLFKSSELSCIEQLIVKQSYCDYSNMTRLSMYTFNEEPKLSLTKSALHVGCPIDSDELLHINDTFYIECDTEMSCPDDELKEVRRHVYYLECREMDMFINETEISTVIYESSSEADIFETKTNTPLLEVLNSSRKDITSTKRPVNPSTLVILSSTEAEERTKLLDAKNFTRVISITSEEITTLTPNEEILNNKTSLVAVKDAAEKPNDYMNVLVILGYSLAALGTTVGIAFGAYKLKSDMQSGSYLFPETPRAPGFIELA